jgi:hypothetical protein
MPSDSSEHKLQGFLITTKILILFFYQAKEEKFIVIPINDLWTAPFKWDMLT